MTPLLNAERLSLSFGGVKAANSLSLSVHKGERLAIVGTNGAGKTTFINIVTGYVKPSEGAVMFGGDDITALTPRQVVRIGIGRSFQVPQLFTSMTVLQNMLVALALKSGKPALLKRFFSAAVSDEAMRMLATFSVQDYAHAGITTLSQGVRKLVDVAMAVTGAPRLVFLDEPTSGISSQERAPLMGKVMRALEHGNMTFILIEHDMSIVREYATRVVALHQGSIIADGPTKDVLADRQVRELIVGTR